MRPADLRSTHPAHCRRQPPAVPLAALFVVLLTGLSAARPGGAQLSPTSLGTGMIRPAMLRSLGGAPLRRITAVALTGDALYVAGDVPGRGGADVLVACLRPDRPAVFARLAGSGEDHVAGMTVDALHRVWLAGQTASPDFPSYRPLPGGAFGRKRDGFVAALSADLGRVVFSSPLGGSGDDEVTAVAADPAGSSYVSGVTDSPDFPGLVPPVGSAAGGGADAFVCKIALDARGAPSLVYGARLGGRGADAGRTITVDKEGFAVVAGETASSDFPTSPGACQGALSGSSDAFVARLARDGESLVYSTYLGGSGRDAVAAVALDPRGQAYVAGTTGSADFPITAGSPPSPSGRAAFAAELDAGGTCLRYGVCLGEGEGHAIGVDPDGAATVAWTSDPPGGAAPGSGEGREGILARVSAGQGSFLSSVRLGGAGEEELLALAGPDPAGRFLVAGETTSAALHVAGGVLAAGWRAPGSPGGFVALGLQPGRSTAATAATAAPSNLRAFRANPTQIKLVWNDNSSDEAGFRIERRVQDGTFSEVASVAANTVSFFDTPPVPETRYFYRVRAATGGGGFTAYTNEANASLPPRAPTNLRLEITGTRPTGEVVVRATWQDNSQTERGFRLERRDPSLPVSAALGIAVTGPDVTTVFDPTASPNTSYVYDVRAFDDDPVVFSAPSNEVPLVTSKPAAPTSLTATAVSSSLVAVDWNFSSGGATGFRVQRRTSREAFSDIATTSATTRFIKDSDVVVNTTYIYRVLATNALGDSLPSNEDSATVLAAPSALTARALNGNQVLLSWTDNSLNLEAGFQIRRGTSDASQPAIFTTGANVREFADTGLSVSTTYFYRVLAVGTNKDQSTSSALTSVQTLVEPADLRAEPLGRTRVVLTWTDRSEGETGFWIERRTASAEWAHIATTGPGATTYTDEGLAPATRYRYRVRATNDTGHSDWCPVWPWVITFGAAEGELEVARQVRFGRVPVGDTAARTLVVRNRSLLHSLNVSIEAPQAPFHLPPAAFTLAPGSGRTVRVRFAPSQSGPSRGTLRLFSGDPRQKEVRVRLMGTGAG